MTVRGVRRWRRPARQKSNDTCYEARDTDMQFRAIKRQTHRQTASVSQGEQTLSDNLRQTSDTD